MTHLLPLIAGPVATGAARAATGPADGAGAAALGAFFCPERDRGSFDPSGAPASHSHSNSRMPTHPGYFQKGPGVGWRVAYTKAEAQGR